MYPPPAAVALSGAYPPGLVFPMPSRWQIKQNWMWGDMTIKDEWGNEIFQAKTELFTLVNKLRFIDKRTNMEVAYIKEALRCFGMPKYSIYVGGPLYGTIKQEYSCCGVKFTINRVDGTQILVSGDLMAHSYVFRKNGHTVASVEKKWATVRDTYTCYVQPGENVIFILACCIVIDKCTTKN